MRMRTSDQCNTCPVVLPRRRASYTSRPIAFCSRGIPPLEIAIGRLVHLNPGVSRPLRCNAHRRPAATHRAYGTA
jgi:hypothetical protein